MIKRYFTVTVRNTQLHYTQRRKYSSREYPTEMLGIRDLGIPVMLPSVPKR